MIAVIFEVELANGKSDQYLALAADLRSELERIEGFLSIERFQSLTQPDKMLSLSFFRDEAAVTRWRNSQMHRMAQRLGRTTLFSHYRLRVAEVMRDYGMIERDQAPSDTLFPADDGRLNGKPGHPEASRPWP